MTSVVTEVWSIDEVSAAVAVGRFGTSGPGYEWPEEYRVTYLPGLNKYIFTASRDGDDMFGCADHAIGVGDKQNDIRKAARKVISAYWRTQADGWDQQRWECILDEGLIEGRTAMAWAAEVWSEEEEFHAEEDDCA